LVITFKCLLYVIRCNLCSLLWLKYGADSLLLACSQTLGELNLEGQNEITS